jgi:F-type H+-transporting ATPase subunit b
MFNNVILAAASEQLALGNLVFLLLAMTVLLLLLKKFAWGPVTKMMQDRADKIANDLDSAEEARVQAQKLADEREAQLKSARTDANTIIADAKEAANKQSDQIVADAQQAATAMKQTASAQIEHERTEALAGVQNDVAELSVTIAQKIIQKELKLDDQKALIDAYIEGLGDK